MDQEYERKKAILSNYISLQRSIAGYGEELAKWAAIGTKINQSYQESLGIGENNSKPENAGINLVEIQEKISKDIESSTIERDNIKNIIKTAPYRYREILIFRYVNGLSIGKISETMQKDERSVKRILKDATLSVDV